MFKMNLQHSVIYLSKFHSSYKKEKKPSNSTTTHLESFSIDNNPHKTTSDATF